MNENLGKIPGAEAVCEKQFLISVEADPALKAEYCKGKLLYNKKNLKN